MKRNKNQLTSNASKILLISLCFFASCFSLLLAPHAFFTSCMLSCFVCLLLFFHFILHLIIFRPIRWICCKSYENSTPDIPCTYPKNCYSHLLPSSFTLLFLLSFFARVRSLSLLWYFWPFQLQSVLQLHICSKHVNATSKNGSACLCLLICTVHAYFCLYTYNFENRATPLSLNRF